MTDAALIKFEGDNLTHRQLKINDQIDAVAQALAAVTKAADKALAVREKLTLLRAEEENAAKYDALKQGDTVRFSYGRGDTRRVESGVITAVGHDEKQGVMFAVQIGVGLDAQIVKIARLAVLLDNGAAP